MDRKKLIQLKESLEPSDNETVNEAVDAALDIIINRKESDHYSADIIVGIIAQLSRFRSRCVLRNLYASTTEVTVCAPKEDTEND